MPKVKVTPRDRVNEFANEGFYLCDNKLLMCKFCNCRLEHERRDTLTKHVSSVKHKLAKSHPVSTVKRQFSIAETIEHSKKVKNGKEEFVRKTTEAFVSANIPVEKLDNPELRGWFQEYVKGGGDLPTADWLRKKYIPIVAKGKEETIRSAVKNKPIIVLSDETTDKGGRCVFNVVFKTLEPSTKQSVFLAASVVLDCADSSSCARAIVEVLGKYEVDYTDVLAFVSDSARYMTKCATTLQGLFGGHLIHVQCWAHKIHLVGVVWQNNLDELNAVVTKVKNAFINTRKRKHQYLEFLVSKYPNNSEKHKLFPQPVITRWNTWFESVLYLNEHLQDIIEFFEDYSEDNSGIKFLKQLTAEELSTTKVQALIVAENCTALTELIKFLEGTKYPTAHLLHTKLRDLENKFHHLSTGLFSPAVRTKMSELRTVKQQDLKQCVKLAAERCKTKLTELMQNDPATKAFEAIDFLFNPRNVCRVNVETANFQKYIKNLPEMSQMPVDRFMNGYLVFKKMIESELSLPETSHVDLAKVLCSLKEDYSDFSKASLRAIWFPTSNVDCERSFSKYSLVVSDRRQRLTPENAERLTMIAF